MPGRSRLRANRSLVWPALTGTLVIVVVAAGAAAAIETDTVSSYWRGLWWSISLITTVGFIGQPPRTDAGAALSVVLMVVGFLLLATVSASLAAFFVREEERPRDARGRLVGRPIDQPAPAPAPRAGSADEARPPGAARPGH